MQTENKKKLKTTIEEQIRLKEKFPDMNGFSPRNIKYIRKFSDCWRDYEIVQRVVAQLPWRTNISLLDKLSDEESRLWYAHKVIENGWSKNTLDIQIESKLKGRTGKAINNFSNTLPPMDSDMVAQSFNKYVGKKDKNQAFTPDLLFNRTK